MVKGDKITLKRDANHGDWKTASIHTERWPTIPKGTEVEFVEKWSNFYGTQYKIIGPNGNHYDIEPKDFS